MSADGRSSVDGQFDQSTSGYDNRDETAARNAEMLGKIDGLKIGTGQLFLQTTEQTRMALCISDPSQPDCPIVYSNEAFTRLTGYPREEIIGRNCRFLQGRGTRTESVRKLRAAVEAEEYVVVDILNYRKDGSAFWNAVHVGPIYGEDGELAYFFGSQWDITELLAARETIIQNDRVAEELRHRTNNLFAVLTAIVRLSARGASDVDELSQKIERRIEALASAHKVSLAEEGLSEDRTNLRNLVEAVMQPYRNAHADRIELAGNLVELPRKHVTPLGLTLHELATNALKYGSLSTNEGRVQIDWEVDEDRVVLHWIEQGADDAAPVAEAPAVKGGGSGSRLIEGVIRGIRGTVETEFRPEGFRATICVPASEKVAT